MKRLCFKALNIAIFALLGLAKAQECKVGYLPCADGQCIPEDWVCDGANDCGDFSDEPDNCPPCPIRQFQCDDGRCISATYICDGDNDCDDMSDEHNPDTGTCPSCPDSVFQCTNGRCVLKAYICNGVDNCGDNSDELDDPNECPPCLPTQWRCGNGNCINTNYTCDGDNDCADWSDETEETCPCSDEEIRCKTQSEEGASGACIPPEWVCDEDGIWDCPGGEDEANCSNTVFEISATHSRFRLSHGISLNNTKRTVKKNSDSSWRKNETWRSKPHAWYPLKKQVAKKHLV